MMQETLSIITVIGALASAALMFRTNANTVSRTVIDTYKERIIQLEEAHKESDGRIELLVGQLSQLQGLNTQLTMRIKDLESLIRGGPKAEEFMRQVLAVASSAGPHMVETAQKLDLILAKIDIRDMRGV